MSTKELSPYYISLLTRGRTDTMNYRVATQQILKHIPKFFLESHETLSVQDNLNIPLLGNLELTSLHNSTTLQGLEPVQQGLFGCTCSAAINRNKCISIDVLL